MKTYGYAIEMKSTHPIDVWKLHWNKKIYDSEQTAKEAIVQMTKLASFYEGDSFRVIPLFTNVEEMNQPETLLDVLANTLQFTKLKENWDGYRGVPMLEDVYKNARKLLSKIKTIPSDYFPNPHGTLSLEFNLPDNFIAIEVGKETFSYYTQGKNFSKRKENTEADFLKLTKQNLEKIEKLINTEN